MFQLGRAIAIDRVDDGGSSCHALMPAIDRKCFDRKLTTSHGLAWCMVLRVHACMEVNETGHVESTAFEHVVLLKQRPRKWFFRKEVDFLASLAFVVN